MRIKLYSKDYYGQVVLDSEIVDSKHCEGYYVENFQQLGYQKIRDAIDFGGGYNTLVLYKDATLFTKLNYDCNGDEIYFANENCNRLPDYRLTDYGICCCHNCGDYYDKDADDYEDEDGNHYCCEDCFYEETFYCEGCDCCYNINSNEYHEVNGSCYCNSCYGERYVTCEDCGEEIEREYANWSDRDDCYYCDDCYCEHRHSSERRGDYHDTQRRGFTPQYASNEDLSTTPLLLGTELEFTCENDTDDVLEEIDSVCNADKELFGFEYDSSVCDGCEGAEMVSQPCSIDWWYESQGFMRNTLQTMINNTCKSHNSHKSCGLHIHFNRSYINDDADTISRIVYIFEKFKEPLVKFSRRTSNQLGSWCRFLDTPYIENCKKYQYDYDKCRNHGDRYYAVNITNRDTVEIRLFRGTLKFEAYYSCLELVRNIVDFAKDKKDSEVENVTFDEIINYKTSKYLKDYCLERELI